MKAWPTPRRMQTVRSSVFMGIEHTLGDVRLAVAATTGRSGH